MTSFESWDQTEIVYQEWGEQKICRLSYYTTVSLSMLTLTGSHPVSSMRCWPLDEG